ncbi:MAG TPA: ABC transporter substrate-binding protein [Clostridium sp.]|nr:ABC transporter substrate-binding protein [Clostridium sp.]
MRKKWFVIIIIILFIGAEVVSSIVNKHNNTKKEVVFMNNFFLMSNKLNEYEKEFEKLHPDIDIKNECISENYETICSYRLNAGNAGDVMVVPSSMNISYYKDYYEPLGTLDEISKKYRFAEIKSVDNIIYSIPTNISISGGIMYNVDVLNKVGISEIPKTYEEFLKAMKTIKNNGDFIPLYSNSKDGEHLKYWNSIVYTVSGNPDYNEEFALSDDLFENNNSYYNVYKLLYTCIDEDLVESNYLTSTWKTGLSFFKNGKVGAAIVDYNEYLKIKNQYENEDSIVYVPFLNEKNNKCLYLNTLNGLAINIESKHREEAKIWLEFLLNNTDFLYEVGDSGILCSNDNLELIKKVEKEGMDLIYSNEKNQEVLGLFEKRDNDSALGLSNGTFATNLISNASSGKKSYNDLCENWNKEWKKSN